MRAGFLVAALACLSLPCRGEDAIKEDTTPIRSVLQRGNTIIAATEKGIYQADTDKKKWIKLGTPPEMSRVGRLMQQDAASPVLGYYTTLHDGGLPPSGSYSMFCVSEDAGKTWRLTSQRKHITEYYLHPDGPLFACELTPTPGQDTAAHFDYFSPGTVLMSRDYGATWKDIRANLPPEWSYHYLMRDPEHPGQVCVQQQNMSGSLMRVIPVYQATGPDYQGWKQVDPVAQFQNREEWSPWMSMLSPWPRYWGGEGCAGEIEATLANFFTWPFLQSGNDLTIHAVRVQTGQLAYTFRKDGPMVISVRVEFLIPHAPVKLYDNKDASIHWKLDVMKMDDKGAWHMVRNLLPPGPPGPEDDAADSAFDLDDQHPYAGKIDIAQLRDFSQPGRYQVRILHCDRPLRKNGGDIGGQVIDVTITP